jgi:hypothetical protein
MEVHRRHLLDVSAPEDAEQRTRGDQSGGRACHDAPKRDVDRAIVIGRGGGGFGAICDSGGYPALQCLWIVSIIVEKHLSPFCRKMLPCSAFG